MEARWREAMEDEDAELEEGEAKEALDPDKDFSYLVNGPAFPSLPNCACAIPFSGDDG